MYEETKHGFALGEYSSLPLTEVCLLGILTNPVQRVNRGEGSVSWSPSEELAEPNTSCVTPRFYQTDDLRQWINGPTLQVDTVPWVKLWAWVFQTVEVEPNSRVQFQVRAVGFVKEMSGYILRDGVNSGGASVSDIGRREAPGLSTGGFVISEKAA